MRRGLFLLAGLLLALPAYADMYQDMSNAVGGKRAGVFYAQAFGACTWDATHDVGACVNQAIEAAHAVGGGTVTIPPGTYGVSTTIATSRNSIGIACNAPSGGHYAYPVDGGCVLKWIGSPGGRIMAFTSGTTQALTGAKIDNIKFNGNNGLAANGLLLSGTFGGEFNKLTFVGGFTGGKVLSLDVPVMSHNPTTIGTQHNQFYSTAIHNNGYSSVGLYLGFYHGPGGSDWAANASANNFYGTQIGSGGKPLWCLGCDNNHFEEIWLGADTGPAIDLDIYNANGRVFGANHNIFRHVAWIGHSGIARGTPSVAACAPMSYPLATTCTWGNTFDEIDGSNGSQPPIIEVGAFASWRVDYGSSGNMNSLLQGDGQRPVQTIMHDTGATNTCGADALSFGAGTGSYYCGPDWSMQYFSNGNNVAQSHYGVGLSGPVGAEKLTWRRWAGTGLYEFADAPIRLGVSSVGALPTCNAARQYAVMAVFDQAGAPTYRGPLTGGGTLAVLAYCNGTSWEAH